MSMEFTKAQAEKMLCPIVSRPGNHVNCRTTQCVAWAWSSQEKTMVRVTDMPKVLPDHIDDLVPPEPGWTVDRNVPNLYANGWICSDGRIRKSDSPADYDAPYVALAGRNTKIRWIKPWDETRLGGCEICAAKVVDVDVSN